MQPRRGGVSGQRGACRGGAQADQQERRGRNALLLRRQVVVREEVARVVAQGVARAVEARVVATVEVARAEVMATAIAGVA